MRRTNMDSLANIRFSLKWSCSDIEYDDTFLGRGVNFWRDWFPPQVAESLLNQPVGGEVEIKLNGNDRTIFNSPNTIIDIKPNQFNGSLTPQATIEPHYGRFYPQGILKDLPNIFKSNLNPFRVVDLNRNRLTVDLNHPLFGQDLRLCMRIEKLIDKIAERGGASVDWIDTIANGPGMQARVNGKSTRFFDGGAFARIDEQTDTLFYQASRMVSHLDQTAIETVTNIYRELLEPGTAVLDLMSSWQSHLPEDLKSKQVTGLGLNRAELEANGQLTDFVVHDLNLKPVLPFEDNTYDAVVCAVSIEYLVHPFEVFREVARVLRPEGRFVVTFSNRWFPPKAIQIWSEIHEFERVGLVTEYFLKDELFKDLAAVSVRGLPRPVDDKYVPEIMFADPIYCVSGKTS